MQTVQQLREASENYLAQACLPVEPNGLYAPIAYALGEGGKRLRPLLTLLGCQLYGGDVREAMPCAAAMEVFHNFTLVHDDIMDNAPVRRGKPSVHARWDESVAILSGDAMLVWTYGLLQKAPSRRLAEVLELFNRMAMQVFEGQQYDMEFEARRQVSVEEYMHMIELKTAVLLAGSAVIGALLAGAPPAERRRLHQAVTELGLAFQLQDDWLDAYGGEELGKSIGGDILEGKKTFLAVAAAERLPAAEAEELAGLHRAAGLDASQKIARALELYAHSDVERLTGQRIALHFDRALKAIDGLHAETARKEPLREFARSLIGRRR